MRKAVVQRFLAASFGFDVVITSLAQTIVSDSAVTITATITGTHYDGMSVEYSTDNVTWSVKGTSATNVYNATGLTENYYYWRVRFYKGGYFGDYSDVIINEWPLILYDGNTWNISDFTNESTITKDGANRTSSVAVLFGANNPLLQAGADNIKPIWSADGITLDGVRQYMEAVGVLNQPTWVYLCLKQITWTDIDYIIDGITINGGAINQRTTTPKIQMFSGTTYIIGDTQFPVNTKGILRALFNGTESKLQVNNLIPTFTQTGTTNMGGVSLGRPGSLDGYYSNILATGLVVRKIRDKLRDSIDIYNKINTKYSVGAPEVIVETGQFDNGKLVICFDDALESVYTTGFPIFTAQGEKFTIAVIGNLIGGASNCSAAELQEMAAAGHDMQCHTHTHINLASSTSGAITANLDANDAAFTAAGITPPIHISYPYGYYNKTAIDAMVGRRVSGRITTMQMADFIPIYKDTDKFQLSSIYVDNLDDAGLTALNLWLDDAKAKRYAIIVFAHGVTEAGSSMAISINKLNQIIDSAQAKGLDIITRSQLYTAMTS